MNEEISLIKLISGEEIITKILDIADGVATIVKPVVMRQGPEGNVIMIPWLQVSSNDGEMKISVERFMLPAQPLHKEVLDLYITSTTGIDVSNAKPNIQLIT